MLTREEPKTKAALAKIEQLPPLDLAEMVNHAPVPNVVEYDVEGTAIGIGLYTDKRCQIMRAFMSSGTIVQPHTHEGHEWMIVVDGEMVFRVGGQEIQCLKGQGVHIEPNVKHGATAYQDTRFICVASPPVGGYPNGR